MEEDDRTTAAEVASENRRLKRKLDRAVENLARLEDVKETMRVHLQTVIANMQQAEDELVRKNRDLEGARVRLEASEREARAANVAKSAFLANMSHELRTPLNAIIGYVELLLEDDPVAQLAQDELDAIRGAGRHLLSVINDILDISKIEAGQVRLELHPVDLAALARTVGATMRPLATARALALEIVAPEPVLAIGDGLRIQQVLTNLVSNAIKFTERGQVRLTVAADQGEAVFLVEDTGIGMTEDQLQRVFDPFVQADNTTTRRYGGTGLGLAICRQLVELHHGTIALTSRPGVGTRCEVTLPTSPLVGAS